MKHNLRSKINRKKAKTVLRLPDLEFAKTAALRFCLEEKLPVRLRSGRTVV